MDHVRHAGRIPSDRSVTFANSSPDPNCDCPSCSSGGDLSECQAATEIRFWKWPSPKPSPRSNQRAKGREEGKEDEIPLCRSQRESVQASDRVIRLNVGGMRYTLLASSLERFPESLLGKVAALPPSELIKNAPCHAILQPENELFFNRPGHLFAPIAQLYQTGHIHRLPGLCSKAFTQELAFWGIFPSYVKSCCKNCIKLKRKVASKASRALPRRRRSHEKAVEVPSEDVASLKLSLDEASLDIDQAESEKTDPSGSLQEKQQLDLPTGQRPHQQSNSATRGSFEIQRKMSMSPEQHAKYERFRRNVWENMEGNKGGTVSMLLNIGSIVFILVNLALIILDSLPGYHYTDYIETIKTGRKRNATIYFVSESGKHYYGTLDHNSVVALYALDWLCTSVFTMELLIRLWAAPDKPKFLKSPMTIIDILSIFPAYIEVITNAILTSQVQGLGAVQVLRALRTFRVFRVLKLARFQSSFQIIGKCMTESVPEFILLFFHLFVATLLFGSLLYYIELTATRETPYKTIPDAVYWSIVTYFSYADSPPVTVLGKMTAATASVMGIVLMALPVSVVVDKFSHYFAEARKLKEAAKRKQKKKARS